MFVNTDACMAAQGVTIGVREKLKARLCALKILQQLANT